MHLGVAEVYAKNGSETLVYGLDAASRSRDFIVHEHLSKYCQNQIRFEDMELPIFVIADTVS